MKKTVNDFSFIEQFNKKDLEVHKFEDIQEILIINKVNKNYIVLDKNDIEMQMYFQDFFEGAKISEIYKLKKSDYKFKQFLNQAYYFINHENFDFKTYDTTPSQLLKLDITYSCDLNCKHCFQGTEIKQENKVMSFDDFKLIVDSYTEFIKDGEKSVVISGGEPTMNKNLIDMLIYLKKNNFNTHLISNGLLLGKMSKSCFNKYAQHLDSIQLSLDGLSERVHDNRRFRGSFNSVIISINRALELNLPIDINITIGRDNYKDIEDNLLTFLERFNYSQLLHIAIEKVHNIGNALEDDFTYLEYNQFLIRLYAKYVRELKLNPSLDFETPIFYRNNCSFNTKIVFNPDGDVNICGFEGSFLIKGLKHGNTFQNILKEIDEMWKASTVDNIEVCRKCKIYGFCTGWCKAENLLRNKDIKNPVCNEDYKNAVFYRFIIKRKYGNVYFGSK